MFKPDFIITNRILNNISSIEAAEETIRHAPLLPLWEKEFKEDAVVRSVHHGTHIEGKKLHRTTTDKILLSDQIGEYRTNQVIVKNSKTGEVTFRPPAPIQIPFMMREFIYWINRENQEELHPILKAAIAHHQLVYIHPFINPVNKLSHHERY